MAISRISAQDTQANNLAVGSNTVSYPSATTSGDLLIAIWTSDGPSDSVVSSGWTLKSIISSTPYVYYAWKISGGDTGIEITVTGTGGIAYALDLFEYTGNNATQPDPNGSIPSSDTNSHASVSTYTTASISTNNANDLILSAMSLRVNGGTNPSSLSWSHSTLIGVNQTSDIYNLVCGEHIVSSTQSGFTDTLSWTTAVPGATSMVLAFQAAGGGGPTPTGSTLGLMGVG